MWMGVWGWWVFEIISLIAYYVRDEITAETELRSLGLLTFMIPVGLSTAASKLTVTATAEGRKNKLLRYFNTCVVLAVGIAVF